MERVETKSCPTKQNQKIKSKKGEEKKEYLERYWMSQQPLDTRTEWSDLEKESNNQGIFESKNSEDDDCLKSMMSLVLL